MLRVRLSTTLLLIAIVAVGIAWYVEVRRRDDLDARLAAARAEMTAMQQALSARHEWDRIQPDFLRKGWASVAESEELVDRGALEGDWLLVSGEEAGRAIPPGDDSFRLMRMLVKDDEVVTTTDHDKSPRRHYFRTLRGRGLRGVDETTGDVFRPVRKGIYMLDGDTLTICWGNDGERPRGFDSRPDRRLLVFRRTPP
jgi:uncharacterized protein (TIGR03067 family)